jgi:hypothetical protein
VVQFVAQDMHGVLPSKMPPEMYW